MKSSEFISEEFEEDDELQSEVEDYDFNSLLLQMFKQAYPNTTFVDQAGKVFTPDEDFGHGKTGVIVMAGTTIEQTKKKNYVGIYVTDAFTGNYKGVLGNAIQHATNDLLQMVPGSIPVLWIESDESIGEWKAMAKKLGYKLKVMDY